MVKRMGRNSKEGLDYFSHDCDISDDEKMQLLQAECGIIGYAVFLKLLERIYRNGYFLDVSDKFISIFSMKNSIEKDVCKNVIDVCIKEDLFNKNLYENYGILTSHGIQKRYLHAVGRRKAVYVYGDIMLIDVNINGKYDNINASNDYRGTHSIV